MVEPGVELVVVGDELLTGRSGDTSSEILGRRLAAAGLPVARRTVIGDSAVMIAETLEQAVGRSRLVFVVGGLGSTPADRTVTAVAELLGRKTVLHPPTLRRIEKSFRQGGRRVPALARQQARVVPGARLFPNPVGFAPACLVERQGTVIVLLPGIPAELDVLFTVVEPFLRARFVKVPASRVQVRTTGESESVLAGRVERALRRHSSVATTYYPSTTGVDIVLSAPSALELEDALGLVRKAVDSRVYEVGERDIAEVVGELLATRRLTLATAESCTAGLVAARITDVPGSSGYFRGGVIAYSNSAKTALIEVGKPALDRHGAVSRAVAQQMASGVAGRFGADVGLSVTGIAGPGGATPDKPVGLVFTAAAVRGRLTCERLMLGGKRRAIREQAVAAVLDLCRRALESDR